MAPAGATRTEAPARPRAPVLLGGLVLARAMVYVALGPGFVSDDWSLAGAMHLDGHQGRFILESRPGSWAVFTAVYGIGGLHPVAVFALVTLLYLAVVLALMLIPETVTARPRFVYTAFPLFLSAGAWWPEDDETSWAHDGWTLLIALCAAGLVTLTALYGVYGAIP